MLVTHRAQAEDLSWVGTRVKQAMMGKCPFCGLDVDFSDVDEGRLHRCPDLPRRVSEILIKEFSENEALLVGPANLVYARAERILEKYPEVKIWVIVPTQ